MEELWKEYAHYLTDEIGFCNKRWEKVVLYLHNIDFEVVVPMDENRRNDGIYERKGFIRARGLEGDTFIDHDASVLEVLVALVKRICEEYVWSIDFNGDDMRWMVFEAFIKNLGLYPTISKDDLHENVQFWMDRDYDEDGKYSIMPLNFSKRGYNFMEIWSQVSVFLTENDLKNWEDFEKFL